MMAAVNQGSVENRSAQPAGAGAAVRTFPTADDFDRDVWSVFGLPFDRTTAPDAVAAIERSVRDRTRLSFVTPNVNFLVRALGDPSARAEILDADLSLIDGAPVALLARLMGMSGAQRCAGSDVFEALRARPSFQGRQIRVFFFGGRDGAAEAAAAAINKESRGLIAVGHLNPGHGDVESMSSEAVISAINAARPDFVIAALGAAKGLAWIDRNRGRLEAPVISHLGAVVDFTAGTIARAPAAFRRFGLEWAWRIKEEPGLWRRYRDDAIALVRLLATRLAPALASRSSGEEGEPARADLAVDGRTMIVALGGDCRAGGLDAVRAAFRRASAAGLDITLDLTAASRMDAAFLGLVLMLEKHLRRQGRMIAIAGASKAHERLFRAHALPFERVAARKAATAGEGGIAAAQ